MDRPLRVLLAAYACAPDRGSEPQIGWNWATQAARFHGVWVVTRAKNREAIERALAREPRPGLTFVYHDLPAWARWWKRSGRGTYPYYLLWHLTALPLARRLHREVGFDLGHHVTFGSLRFPSVVAGVPGLPFVWGPVGGGERAPRAFSPTLGRVGAAKLAARDLSNGLVRLDPLVALTARRATRILTTTPASAAALPASARTKAEVVPAMGLAYAELAAAARARPDRADGTLRLVFVGRLVAWKGVQLVLAALARVARSRDDVRLTIVGDGPNRARLQRQATELGVAPRVRFVGGLPRADVQELVAAHDVFVFPSLHDSGGFAVLEAMAAGLPVVCLDLGGPGLAVTAESGIKVAATDPAATIVGLATAIERLADEPELRRRLGEGGRRRVAEAFAVERLGERLRALYASCVEPGEQR